MNKQERIKTLLEAQELLFSAIELIEEATEGTTEEANTKAYLIDHLQILASEEHGFLTNDLNIDKVIASF